MKPILPQWLRCFCITGALQAIGLWGTIVAAQELTPRAYWPAPAGTHVAVVGYQYSSGDVVTDPSLPITGVDSKIHSVQVSYLHTFALFGRTANAQVNLPFGWGSSDGLAEGEFRSRTLSGLSDMRARLSINLRGAPTMDIAGFQALRAKPRTIIGVSLQVQAPTGDYEPGKVINQGTNRWAIEPAFGLIWPMRPTWLLELEVGTWFFTDNDDFLGVTREQDPIVASQLHLVKRLRPGFWVSLDANFYAGGRTTVDRELRADLQRNSRFGATVVFPFQGRHAVRGSYSTGVVTESGGDFDSFTLGYAYAWR